MNRLASLKTGICYFLLLAVAVVFTACATAPQELMVVVDKDRIEEAWERAYDEGLAMGYERERHDIENKIAEFNRKEVDQPLPMNLFIKMHLEVAEESCVLWLEGKDLDIAREDEQVLDDMQRIVTKIERCCGIKDEAGKPVKK